MYACDKGLELMSKWYAQVSAGMEREWTDLALADYFNHRHSCPVCHDLTVNPIGNVPIPVSLVCHVLKDSKEEEG